MPRDPGVLAHELIGGVPDEIEPLVVFQTRATHRVSLGAERFVVKTDDEHATVAHEIAGHQRALAASIPVPEIIGIADDAFAMRWVDGVQLDEHSTPAAWADAGRLLRRVHDLGSDASFGAGFGGYEPERGTWREFFDSALDRVLHLCARELDFPAEQAARIRAAARAAAPVLDAPQVVWSHGDFQTEHVLVDPATDRVTSIIDWADHGTGDRGWDISVVTIDDASGTGALLDGYGAGAKVRSHLDDVMPLFTVSRLLGGAHWLSTHGYSADERLRRAIAWRP